MTLDQYEREIEQLSLDDILITCNPDFYFMEQEQEQIKPKTNPIKMDIFKSVDVKGEKIE